MHVWDEFSEFLPENRVPTLADFNTYPIRIFSTQFCTLEKNFLSFLFPYFIFITIRICTILNILPSH